MVNKTKIGHQMWLPEQTLIISNVISPITYNIRPIKKMGRRRKNASGNTWYVLLSYWI
jgi:hypothetical protein